MRSVTFSEWLRPWGNAGVTFFLAEYPVDVTRLAPEFMPQSLPRPHSAQPSRTLAPTSSQSSPMPHVSPGGASAQESAPHANIRQESTSAPGTMEAGLAQLSAPSHHWVPPRHSSDSSRLAEAGQGSGSLHDGSPHGVPDQPLKQGERAGEDLHYSKTHGKEHATTENLESVAGLFPLNMEEWPVPFREYFSRLAPSPVLWCYETLGQDLFGDPNRERSDCLKGLIAKLQFPKGTSVFWPPVVPSVEDIRLSQRVLLQVLRELFPKLVIILGTGQALSLFHGDSQPLPFTQRLFQGHMVVFLPDFDALMESASLFNQSVRYLRAIVAQLSIV